MDEQSYLENFIYQIVIKKNIKVLDLSYQWELKKDIN
ncbi:hypothetical protein LCGC14_2365340 [marine sediment metagenome]|uniref:Uncharacterized protein n=1 Tax=marine sediment metagenome TaxID=412755 RepID=A0A0F9F068_9ZZZZ